MTAPPGFVFTVSTLRVTAAWADDVTATFTGYSSEGALVDTVSVTANQAGPAVADLTSLGRISTLEMKSSSCGVNAPGSCFSAAAACVPVPLTFLAFEDIVVTGDCCHVRRRC